MSRFLLLCWSFETHSDTFLSVASELCRQGHEVAFYAALRDRDRAEAVGARFYPFQAVSQEQADAALDGVLRNRKQPWKIWSWWRRLLLDSIPAQLEDLTSVISRFSPHVLVADNAMWAVPAVLRETTGIPVVVLSHIGFSLEPGDSGPVHGRAMPPRRTALQRLAARAVESLSAFATRDTINVVTRIRAGYQLPPVNERMTQLLGRMDLYLIPSCASFDYSRTDLPPSVKYVGPCLWPETEPVLLDARPANVRPRIVVDEGSLHAPDLHLFRAVAAGLANLPLDVTMLAGKRRRPPTLDVGKLASNVTLLPWQPLGTAIDTADLVITNGNTDSAMAALSRGIPTLVVPSILDQAEIAMRVSLCGAGLTLGERLCSPQDLRTSVERLLAEPAYRRAAARIAAGLNALGGPRAAVGLLEGLAKQRGATV